MMQHCGKLKKPPLNLMQVCAAQHGLHIPHTMLEWGRYAIGAVACKLSSPLFPSMTVA
jgi:hypothetical protein